MFVTTPCTKEPCFESFSQAGTTGGFTGVQDSSGQIQWMVRAAEVLKGKRKNNKTSSRSIISLRNLSSFFFSDKVLIHRGDGAQWVLSAALLMAARTLLTSTVFPWTQMWVSTLL